MRVLMTTMQLDIGGAETHIVELSKALSRRGVEVIVASNGGAYETELKEAGIRHIKVPFHSKNPLCMKRAYAKLKEIILTNHIDVVHAHARIPAFLCALLHRRYHFRFVTTAHWVFSTRFPYNFLTRWGDRSLAVSDDIKTYLSDNYGINSEHVRVTINGIDLEKFSKDTDYSAIAEEFNLSDTAWRIVYVSRMDIDRSLAAHKLLAAAEGLAAEIKNLEIVIVGGGNDFEEVKKEAETVNAAVGRRMVVVTGSRTDINRFVACGDIFIGVSRAALEAMACEKPSIIAGNEGYIGIFDRDKLQTAIDTNFCCRGCAQTETETLKQDILTLYRAGNTRRAELGAYARETVRQHYSIDTMADDAIKMYISIIKNSKINEVMIEEFDDIEAYLLTNPIRMPGGGIDVMISGYYGFHNSGDDSILKSMVDSLSVENPDIKILALSNDPAETKALYGIESIHRFNLPGILWNLKRTKLLISGGGSLIQDVTSEKSLAYYLFVIRAGLWMGAKVMLYANGIGPIRNERNYHKIAKTLNRVDLITLREPSSLEELKRFGVTNPRMLVTADPAFRLTAAGTEEAAALCRRAGISEGTPYFVISLRPWKFADSEMEKIIAGVADRVCEQYHMEALFVPMQESRDLATAKKTLSYMKQRGRILEGSPTPTQILGVVGGAQFVLGMRLHTLIYAAKMGTPLIGLCYDPKVDATMEYIGQEFTCPARDINPLTLLRYVDEIMQRRDKLCEDLAASGAAFEEKASENTRLALSLFRED